MIPKSYNGHNFVLIVGCPRSGTTWLQRLLAAHPRIRTGQESDLFDSYIGPQLRAWRRELDPKSSGRGGVGLACYFKEEEFMNILSEYMLKLMEPMVGSLQPGEIFVEKTPSHALFIREIMELLPEIRIIHVLRDARDVVSSLLTASKSWGETWAPRHSWGAARMWVEHVKAVQQAAHALSKKQFFEIRYEDLCASSKQGLRNVCNFLGLEWDERELEKAIAENSVEETKVRGGTPIPVGGEFARVTGSVVKEPSGFVRKARPGAWRVDLSWIEKVWTWTVAHKAMKELGYHWAHPWSK
jgi:LPS sulfotransferase NodH